MSVRADIDLGSTLRRVGDALHAVLHWWLGELAACVPAGLKEGLSALRGRRLLIVEDGALYLSDAQGRRRELLGRIDGSPGGAFAVGRRKKGEMRTVTIRLPEDRALRSIVSLPVVAERNLAQVVGFEFERLTPFKREDVDYHVRVLGRDRNTRQLRLELTVISRALVRDVVRAAGRWDLHPAAVEVAGPDGVTRVLSAVLRTEEQSGARRTRRIALAVLSGMAVLLVMAALVIPLIQADREIHVLTTRVAEARRQAEDSARLQKAIEAAILDSQILIERKRGTVPVVVMLDEMSRLLPDDTWLTELVIAGNELRVAGYASSATSLLGLLDQAENFSNAALRSPVTQDTRLNRERFSIAVQIGNHR